MADRLGISTRTAERYRAGKLTRPQRLLAALMEATASEWQPQVRAQPREQASTSGGMMVHVVAYFGFTASGSSDDGRGHHVTTAISPTYAAQILQLQEHGATKEDLNPIVAEAIPQSYFRDWGTRCHGPGRGFHARPVNKIRVLTRSNAGPATSHIRRDAAQHSGGDRLSEPTQSVGRSPAKHRHRRPAGD
ncbi:telomere-protecting terminal protein Tpg [Streptomyces sp. NPDC096354]|uniref:telomere-protecting terminal protein Tpg n=1 Tax=Streptomyces sp. NPDC096354 TaxID=3366088 RepID=UPI0037FAA37D